MPTIRIEFFDTWREGYAGAEVSVKLAGTDNNAEIWLDEDLTIAADNPQTLLSQEINERQYGKFEAPIYTSDSYELWIDGVNSTGVIRPPITTLDGADAGEALATSAIGTEAHTIEDIIGRVVHVEDFGEFLDVSDPDSSATTNNDTLTAAIDAVAAAGGYVELPAGTFAFEGVELATNVRLRGKGRDVTVLQSQEGAIVIEYTGDGAGLTDLTLDGVLLTASSVGVYMKAINNTAHERVTIKRFATNLFCQGARGSRWYDMTLDGGTINAKLFGDSDGDDGGQTFIHNRWTGMCINSVSIGLDLEYIDEIVALNSFRVGFEDNALIAVKIRGARYTDFDGSWWDNNSTHLNAFDFTGGSFADDNTLLGLWIRDFRMVDGDMALGETLEDVVFERGAISNCTITLLTPINAVLARDVVEDADVSLAGTGTKWLRWTSTDHGASFGQTTNNTATKAWSIPLDPGQRCMLLGKVIGNGRNVDESGEYLIAVSARRPPSTLAYDTQTGNFTAGLTITGGTSGATGLIVTDTDGGATGTLEVREIVGEFVDNEIITDSSTGSATVNGTLTAVNAELLGSVESLRAAREDQAGWDATFVANGPEIELRVTGENGKTIDWTVDVDTTKT